MSQCSASAPFRDPELRARFDRDGFVVTRVLSAERAAELRDAVNALKPDDRFDPAPDIAALSGGYHQSELDSNRAYKQRVAELSNLWFSGFVDGLLADYRLLASTLAVKMPERAEVPIHIDPTVQDEAIQPTVYVWCALQDTTEENGTLCVIPGSHGLFRGPYGATIDPGYFRGLKRIAGRAVPVPLKAGEALVFDASIFHSSRPNISGAPRFAFRLTCIPADQTGVMHRSSPQDPGIIETFRMETEDYLDLGPEGLLKGQFETPLVRTRPASATRLQPEEVELVLERAEDIRSGTLTIEQLVATSRAQSALRPAEPVQGKQAGEGPSFVRRARNRIASLLRLATGR
ncbi:phytanoyl-CoA dioxygenase family protein [Novosphingobium sp. TH158]|uniref:phytanoyl-CoA dioxygenase family protein n=1 Tax=Novosphingobium sp. TH158 TaxID=2067455 RepID=UPI0013043978|nr:phytanoyl-CoA dioxygenase family protein [Novosphingobium sp. TH158]